MRGQLIITEQQAGLVKVQSSTSSPFLVSAATASLALLDACAKNENVFTLRSRTKNDALKEDCEISCIFLPNAQGNCFTQMSRF